LLVSVSFMNITQFPSPAASSAKCVGGGVSSPSLSWRLIKLYGAGNVSTLSDLPVWGTGFSNGGE
jgi:hypothetical protein